MCVHCALCAWTFNPVMEFLGSRPIRHTSRTCVCSFAPASTHRQINYFGFYSKTCLFCQCVVEFQSDRGIFYTKPGCKPPFRKSQVVKLWRGASVRFFCCIYAPFLADCWAKTTTTSDKKGSPQCPFVRGEGGMLKNYLSNAKIEKALFKRGFRYW